VPTEADVSGGYSGEGTLAHPDGCTYQGQYQNDKPHGKGTQTYPDGRTYTGQWQHGKPHGEGTLTPPDGASYEGHWKDGKQHGKGTYTWPDGTAYEGQFQNDEYHGEGTYTRADGTTTYTGQWKEDTFHGKGTCTHADGTTYQGQFQDGKMHGEGTHTFVGGEVFKGVWINGVCAGFEARNVARMMGSRKIVRAKRSSPIDNHLSNLANMSLDSPEETEEATAMDIEGGVVARTPRRRRSVFVFWVNGYIHYIHLFFNVYIFEKKTNESSVPNLYNDFGFSVDVVDVVKKKLLPPPLCALQYGGDGAGSAAAAPGAGDGAGSGAGSGGAPTKEVKRETKPGREVIDLSNEDDSIAPAGAGDGAGGSAASGGDQSGFKTPEKAKAERELEASAKKLAASAKKLAASDEKAKKLREENQQLKAEMQRRANEAERDPPLMVIPSGVCDGLGVWIKPGRTLPTTYSLPFGGDDITRREMNQLYPGNAAAIHVVPYAIGKKGRERFLYDPDWKDRTDGKLAMGVNDGDRMVSGKQVRRESHSNMRFGYKGDRPVLRPMERLHGGANGLELLWSYGDKFWNAGAPATVQNDNLNEAKAAGGQHHQGVGGSDVDLDGFPLDMVRHMVAMPMQY
jgi:hypothetical protein